LAGDGGAKSSSKPVNNQLGLGLGTTVTMPQSSNWMGLQNFDNFHLRWWGKHRSQQCQSVPSSTPTPDIHIDSKFPNHCGRPQPTPTSTPRSHPLPSVTADHRTPLPRSQPGPALPTGNATTQPTLTSTSMPTRNGTDGHRVLVPCRTSHALGHTTPTRTTGHGVQKTL